MLSAESIRSMYTKKERDAIVASLGKRIDSGKLPACVICKSEQWEFQSSPSAIETGDRLKDLHLRDKRTRFLPALVLLCKNCGNIHLFNLNVLGVEPEGDSDE